MEGTSFCLFFYSLADITKQLITGMVIPKGMCCRRTTASIYQFSNFHTVFFSSSVWLVGNPLAIMLGPVGVVQGSSICPLPDTLHEETAVENSRNYHCLFYICIFIWIMRICNNLVVVEIAHIQLVLFPRRLSQYLFLINIDSVDT